jgi:DNA-directed RNA polymerase subunit RPC12/RpoP
MNEIPYRCPKCKKIEEKSQLTLVVYDYGKRKPVCAECGTPISDFVPDYRPPSAKDI